VGSNHVNSPFCIWTVQVSFPVWQQDFIEVLDLLGELGG
jgi:hypothetical protein